MRKKIPLFEDAELRQQSQHSFNHPVDKQQVNTLTHQQYSANSLLSLTNDWNRFVSFCQLKHVRALPASITAVRLFIETEAKQRKFATLRRYNLTIGLIHQLHQLPDPTQHRQIHLTLGQFRLQKQGDASQANPFTRQHLQQIHSRLSRSSDLKDLRDLLIYHLMFECVLKRGQLRQLNIEQFRLQNDGNYQLEFEQQSYSLSYELSQVLQRWLAIIAREHGILLSRIDKHGNLGKQALDDSSIYRVFRRASDLLGLPQHLKFSGQSSRVGAAQELHKRGYNLQQIQDIGRWMSPVMPAQYLGQYQLAQQHQLVFKKISHWQ